MLNPLNIKISYARSYWGSCSADGRILFSYKIGSLPIEIIEYVVAHELAHLTHHNHSSDFWNLVSNYYPDYKIAEKWLKQHKYELALSLL